METRWLCDPHLLKGHSSNFVPYMYFTNTLQDCVVHKYFMDNVSPGTCTPQVLYWHCLSRDLYSPSTLWILSLQGLVLHKYFMDTVSTGLYSPSTLWTVSPRLCTPPVHYGHCFSRDCVLHKYFMDTFSPRLCTPQLLMDTVSPGIAYIHTYFMDF